MTKADSAAGADEKRALSREELALADQARQPDLGGLSDRDLSDLISRLRDRRNRARDIGDRQGREARGKADPAGDSAATGNRGTLTKQDFLNAALDRAMAERDGRSGADAGSNAASQTELAEKAFDLKRQNNSPSAMKEDGGPLHPDDPEADPGGKHLENTGRNTAPSGALDEAGSLPARERSGHRR